MYGIFGLSSFTIGVLIIVAIITALIALMIYLTLSSGFVGTTIIALALNAASVVVTLVVLITYYTSVGWGQGGGGVGVAAALVGIVAVVCHSCIALEAVEYMKGH